jgi:pSer/pThr/pTyr-binding forkhead associated (FHA) protein
MVQLNVLSGKKAGCQTIVRHFPCRIGRAAESELPLDDDGVWDRHLTLDFQRGTGFTFAIASDALASVNGQPLQIAVLRNGDIVTLGSVKLQFWLAAPRQRSWRSGEYLVWLLVAAVTAGQFVLIYWLLGME